jgi:hypothetical protein
LLAKPFTASWHASWIIVSQNQLTEKLPTCTSGPGGFAMDGSQKRVYRRLGCADHNIQRACSGLAMLGYCLALGRAETI